MINRGMATNLKLMMLLEEAVEHVKNMSPEERAKMHEEQKKSWVRGNLNFDDSPRRHTKVEKE